MKQHLVVCVFRSVVLSCLLGGCATPAAPGISGHWKPVNHFDPAPEEIPLAPAYVFYAAPMDRTLKVMLERWALDSKMTLRYLHPSDFTLYQAVSRIRTGDLHQAVTTLTSLYVAQRVVVSVEDNAIVVRRGGDPRDSIGAPVAAAVGDPASPSPASLPAAARPGQP
jgi:hypothetical protein